jgi:putative ABC transport system permease protein
MSGLTVMAVRSVRHRLPSFVATGIAVFLCTLMVGAFAGLAETGFADDVPSASRETLLVMGIVIGAWGGVLALFALSSTIAVAVRRRDAEIGLLRSIGATPRMARRLVRREVLGIGLVAAVAGVLASWPVGSALLAALRDGGMVDDSVEFAGGPTSMGAVLVATLLICAAASGIASRRATHGTTRLALAEEVGAPRRSRWRTIGGALLVLAGLNGAVLTIAVTQHDEDPFMAMSTAGNAGILLAVGMAAFAPQLLRLAARLVSPVLGRTGVAGHLAGLTTYHRSHVLGTVLGAGMVFAATTTGIVMLIGIDARTFVLPPGMEQAEADTVALLNNVVVAMIGLFCALVLVNALLAVIGDRRVEFARLRLVGATPEQVRSSVVVEAVLVALVAGALGTLASLATVVPFSIARDEGLVPDGQLWLPPLVALVTVALTVGAATVAVGRSLRRDSVLAAVGSE